MESEVPAQASGGIERLRVLRAAEGRAHWFLGTLAVVRASAEETAGGYSLIEQVARPGFGPPKHVHHVEDEQFYVLEGRVSFVCGDHLATLEAGGSIFLPKGVPHAFRVGGDGVARLLQLTVPGGFDRFVEEIGTPARDHGLPPDEPPPAGLLERMVELGRRHGFTVVGPPMSEG